MTPQDRNDYAAVLDAATPATALRNLLKAHPMQDEFAQAVARHPNCPRNLYSHFLCYFPDDIRQNPAFGLWALEKPEEVRPQYLDLGAMDKRFRAGEGTLYMFRYHLRDADEYRRQCATRYAPADLLEVLFGDPSVAVRRLFAKRTDLPEAWYARLADDPAAGVRAEIARNPSTPTAVRARLAQDSDGQVRAKFVGATTADAHPAPLNDPSAAVRKAYARQCHDAADLTRLAQDKVANVRTEVARNGATPAAVLEALASDANQDVRIGVARNPCLSETLAQRLMHDSPVCHTALAKNNALPAPLQEALYACTSTAVRAEILAHTALDALVTQALADYAAPEQDRDAVTLFMKLADNPHFRHSADLTARLYAHPNGLGKLAAAQRADHLSLSQASDLLRQGHFSYSFGVIKSARPDHLLALLQQLVTLGDKDMASYIVYHPVVAQATPEQKELREQILRALIAGFAKTTLASKAKKLLEQA